MRTNDLAAYLRQAPNNAASTSQIAQAFQIREQTAEAWLKILAADGKVVRAGNQFGIGMKR